VQSGGFYATPIRLQKTPNNKRPSTRIRLGRLLRLLTVDGFAMASLPVQLVLIFIVSAILIFIFTPLTGSLSYCYTLFADPGTYGSADGFQQIFFGFFVLVLGLILVSLIISVLTTALEELIEHIRGGTRPYHKKGHILIIHRNRQLPIMLDEMNMKYAGLGQTLDVVILLGDEKQMEMFWNDLEISSWPFLNIYLRLGDLFAYETYERVSILAALGILLLLDETKTDPYLADSQNIKVLAMLTNEEAFRTHLGQRHAEKRPVKCTVELFHTIKSHEIARLLTSVGGEPLFSVTAPGDIVSTILSRAILDIAYYEIYLELFSFGHNSIYFVNPQRFAAQGLRTGLKFEELSARFTTGVLIGYSYASAIGLDIALAPLGRTLQAGEWLLLIAPNEFAITYEAALPPHAPAVHTINAPAAISQCRLCVIGDERRFENLGDFLNEDSLECYRNNQIVLPRPEEYFDPEFMIRLCEGEFDKIIINLEDDLAFRLSLFIRGKFGEDDPFSRKIITVVDDPDTEKLLNRRGPYHNIILSEKLAAKYVTQLTFQKNLEKVYADLTARDATQIKLLDVDVHIPLTALTNKQEVKHVLLEHGLVYLATVNAQKESCFDAGDFADARQIIVISPRAGA